MPMATLKLIERFFIPEQKHEMIRKITDTMVEVEGESRRPVTQVQERAPGSVPLGRMNSTAPSLRRLTPQASLLLAASAGAWVGVVVVARDMGSMPGTMGLGVGSFVAVWVLVMSRDTVHRCLGTSFSFRGCGW